jgi:hypothetical protein
MSSDALYCVFGLDNATVGYFYQFDCNINHRATIRARFSSLENRTSAEKRDGAAPHLFMFPFDLAHLLLYFRQNVRFALARSGARFFTNRN